jgi:6,7-dimethyl-8-ribityllumazine synthase
MSGSGAPVVQGRPAGWARGVRVVVVAAQWHETVMDGLIAGAERVLEHAEAAWAVVRVPGSFELPVAAKVMLEAGALGESGARPEAVIALGVVIRGGTPHFEYVSQAATMGLTQVAIETGKPVGFGVLTCDDEAQALDRAGLEGSHEDKGAQAAEAALETVLTLRAAEA